MNPHADVSQGCSKGASQDLPQDLSENLSENLELDALQDVSQNLSKNLETDVSQDLPKNLEFKTPSDTIIPKTKEEDYFGQKETTLPQENKEPFFGYPIRKPKTVEQLKKAIGRDFKLVLLAMILGGISGGLLALFGPSASGVGDGLVFLTIVFVLSIVGFTFSFFPFKTRRGSRHNPPNTWIVFVLRIFFIFNCSEIFIWFNNFKHLF